MIPAIVIGAHTMGLGVIRALGTMDVPVIAIYYNTDDMGYVSKHVQESIHFPHPETEENLFLEYLLDLAARFSGSILIPVSDESLKVISRHKPLLQKYYKVACAEWGVIRQLLEKNYTYTLAASVGVPIPKTITPASMGEVIAFAKDLEYPCLVKPVESHSYYALFKRKIVKAGNFEQLFAACLEAERAGLQVMLQELIPGDDDQGVNYNSYFWDGQPLVEFTAQKVRSAPPELGSPCAAMSQKVPEVLEYGRKILKAMGYYGYSCTEFKLDPRDGIYKLMEVNGRHNLSTLLAVNCGINFPWLHYQHLIEGIIPQDTPFREGLFWIDMERDLAYIPQRLFQRKEKLSQILMPYLNPHVSAIFDLQDPMPFFKRYIDFGKKVFNLPKPPIPAK
jgi:predicted ATP-grasp superfamily ATP-dependent carboligase